MATDKQISDEHSAESALSQEVSGESTVLEAIYGELVDLHEDGLGYTFRVCVEPDDKSDVAVKLHVR
jgi:hypothetical protein